MNINKYVSGTDIIYTCILCPLATRFHKRSISRDVYVGAFYGNVYMRVGVAHGARMLADLSDFGLLGGKFHADESPCKIRHC